MQRPISRTKVRARWDIFGAAPDRSDRTGAIGLIDFKAPLVQAKIYPLEAGYSD